MIMRLLFAKILGAGVLIVAFSGCCSFDEAKFQILVEIDHFWSYDELVGFQIDTLNKRDSSIVFDFVRNGEKSHVMNKPRFKRKYTYYGNHKREYKVYLYYSTETMEPIMLQVFDDNGGYIGLIERYPNNVGPSIFQLSKKWWW